MSLAILICIIVLIAAALLAIGAAMLWLVCRRLRIAHVGFGRALLIALLVEVLSVVVRVTDALMLRQLGDTPLLAAGAAIGVGIVGIFAQWMWTRTILRTGWWKAAAALVLMAVPQIVVAVSLALLVRSTLCEAFVMPTGSMAPTLVGVHADVVCDQCGYAFPVSLSDRVAEHRSSVAGEPPPEIEAFCPNCGHLAIIGPRAKQQAGDRFLVDKTTPPKRWDLVAFREPRRGENYVKRLVGLPGETIEIAGGELFINGKLMRKPPQVATDLWFHLHDTAFEAATPDGERPRWRSAGSQSPWRIAAGVWQCECSDGQPQRLEFTGPITDRLAFNGESRDGSLRSHADAGAARQVGDVTVECVIGAFHGEGRFGWEWSFRGAAVEASVDKHGAVTITTRSRPLGENQERTASGQLPSDLTTGDRLAFGVRDGQAYVSDRGETVALVEFGPETAEAQRAWLDTDEAPCQLALFVSDGKLALNRILARRDVYYLGDEWTVRAVRSATPLHLAGDEYFMIGDNNERSVDSRMFGAVRSGDLIGVARWIYWPPARCHAFQ